MVARSRKERGSLWVLLQAAFMMPVCAFSPALPSLSQTARSAPQRSPLPAVPSRFASRVALPTPLAAAATADVASEGYKAKKTIIVGSGPTGLFTSLMLARRGYKNILVLDRLERPAPPDSPLWGDPYRSYNLGLSGRGQLALTAMGAWDTVARCCAVVVGRKDWTEKGEQPERIYNDRAFKTQVIQRDRLTSCLLQEVETKHGDSVNVKYQVEVVGMSEQVDGSVRVSLKDSEGREWTEATQLLVGADGVRSPIRETLERSAGSNGNGSNGKKSDVRTFRYANSNEYVYKTLPLHMQPYYGKGFRPDLNYSARCKFGATLEALPTLGGAYVGVLLFKPDNTKITDIKTQQQAREFFQEAFPQFMGMIKDEDLTAFPDRPISRLPSFAYAGPELHRGNGVVLLGDAIHSVKPYFGLGAQSALEDVMVLNSCLEESGDDVSIALPLFSQRRAPEAAALVQLQQGFDGDPRTVKGALTFLLPIILDGIFNKLLPQVFAPNGIRLLQDHTQSFSGVQKRKRRDRALQVLTLGLGGAVIVKVVKLLVTVARKAVLKA